ncbi:uridine kinase family protein [Pseudactinotalea terrae]|uniref:uridine kinase family protein n=1 Tax=Pseudactinotalea terrae TaxID=1743262 RepID=UPI001F5002B4|nr:uridine kinase [Pseudactinotalea terrae]
MPEQPAELIVEHAMRQGPRCGEVTVVVIDGPAGSGKTTAAGQVQLAARAHGLSCAVIQMDDLYEGWGGLVQGGDAVTEVLRALEAGEPGRYRRYSWVTESYVEVVEVPAVDLLVVEGVGSARTEHLDLVSTLVWVEEADPQERLRRGIERDGAQLEGHWVRWMAQEAALFAEVGARDRADILIDGLGRRTAGGER